MATESNTEKTGTTGKGTTATTATTEEATDAAGAAGSGGTSDAPTAPATGATGEGKETQPTGTEQKSQGAQESQEAREAHDGDLTDGGVHDLDDEHLDDTDAAPTARRGTGLGSGAGAVVAVALGLLSLTGTSLADKLRERKQFMGQIETSAAQSGGAADQINALYGAPWHTAALINGLFALLAVVVGGVLLAVLANRPAPEPGTDRGTPSWVRPLALGGLVLGVIGLLVSGVMYFDLFAAQPELPTAG